jgi:NAD(P)-dependent dehydrogenase (short-subunit alcohol dehydrogenase family)
MLLASGANVVITGRDIKKLKAAVAETGEHDGRFKYIAGDVSSEGYANKLVGETVSTFGSLNILVNNAGVFRMGNIFEASEEDYDYVVDCNLKGVWLMCRYGARAMRESGGGAIVNVSSLLGLRGVKNFPSAAYSAAKGGVLALTRALAVELAPFKIRVNSVVPAIVRTPMLYSVGDESAVEEMIERSKSFHPLGRVGEPEDVARAIVFLADPINSWLTGVEMPVDGGRSVL